MLKPKIGGLTDPRLFKPNAVMLWEHQKNLVILSSIFPSFDDSKAISY
jgi:hypothetical protein